MSEAMMEGCTIIGPNAGRDLLTGRNITIIGVGPIEDPAQIELTPEMIYCIRALFGVSPVTRPEDGNTYVQIGRWYINVEKLIDGVKARKKAIAEAGTWRVPAANPYAANIFNMLTSRGGDE